MLPRSPPAFHRERGSTLVGYSSLMLLVAIAAIALLGQTDAGNEHSPAQRDISSSR